MAATPNGGAWTATQVLDTSYTISTFGEDQIGELYVAQYAETDGVVYRIVAAIPDAHRLADFNGDGKADVLRRHSSGLLDIWLMDG